MNLKSRYGDKYRIVREDGADWRTKGPRTMRRPLAGESPERETRVLYFAAQLRDSAGDGRASAAGSRSHEWPRRFVHKYFTGAFANKG
jgi:hypothetical protein